MTPILIRNAVVDESEAIAWVLRQAFVEYQPLYTPEGFAATTPTSDQIQKRWDEGPVWAAVQKDIIVGTVAAVPKSTGLYIRSMALLPALRGHGIGHNLLQYAEKFAITGNHRRMFLSTTPFLHAAIRLYNRFGFQQTNDGPHELFETPLFTMEKLLPGTDRNKS